MGSNSQSSTQIQNRDDSAALTFGNKTAVNQYDKSKYVILFKSKLILDAIERQCEEFIIDNEINDDPESGFLLSKGNKIRNKETGEYLPHGNQEEIDNSELSLLAHKMLVKIFGGTVHFRRELDWSEFENYINRLDKIMTNMETEDSMWCQLAQISGFLFICQYIRKGDFIGLKEWYDKCEINSHSTFDSDAFNKIMNKIKKFDLNYYENPEDYFLKKLRTSL